MSSLPSISIIIPAYNSDSTIVTTLKSVHRSINFSLNNLGNFDYDVIIVNDHSSDNTSLVVRNYINGRSDVVLVEHAVNMGAGSSRNTGVRHSQGDLLFFLDADDLYLEDHVYLCMYYLCQAPHVQYVRTQMRIDEDIHPYWKRTIEDNSPINICIRRWCHELVGGFPEEDIFLQIGSEDVFYRTLLASFCVALFIEQETVQAIRYPGNSLDRQMHVFSQPPLAETRSPFSAKQRKALPQFRKMQAEKKAALHQSLHYWFSMLVKAYPEWRDTFK